MDAYVEHVVEKALAQECLSDEELLPLLDLDPLSAEAAHVCWGAKTLARRASKGRGQVYAQIGLDALACPMDCQFCGLARINASHEVLTAEPESLVVPLDEVVAYARTFDEAGVHLISLMATDMLPFERFVETVRAVKQAVSERQVVMANCGDISLQQAQLLKAAGASVAYHANRVGEGRITRIKPERRVQTFENIRAAGLNLMTAVEPLYEGVDNSDVIAHMRQAASFEPICSGVGALRCVKGSAMEHEVPFTSAKLELYASVFRLMVGESVPFGTGGANVVWADAGTNPRGRDLSSDHDFLRRDVARLRTQLERGGWLLDW